MRIYEGLFIAALAVCNLRGLVGTVFQDFHLCSAVKTTMFAQLAEQGTRQGSMFDLCVYIYIYTGIYIYLYTVLELKRGWGNPGPP